MVLVIELVISCILFTLLAGGMTYVKPLSMIDNYPPLIQDRVRSLGLVEEKDLRLSKKSIIKKIIALIIFMILFVYVVYNFNGARSIIDGFKYSYIIWSIVNIWDVIVLDIIWFCHSKRVIIPGTEDMKEYKDYWFHIKGGLKGMLLGLPICLLVGVIISLI